AAVAAPLEMHAPPASLFVGLTAGGAEDVAVGKLDRLVLDGAEDAGGQTARITPRAPAVFAGAQHSPPCAPAGADFVKEQQRTGLRLEKHRVPTRMACAVSLHTVGDFDGCRPVAALEARQPDADIGILLGRTAEPRGHQPAGGFDDGRSVARGE